MVRIRLRASLKAARINLPAKDKVNLFFVIDLGQESDFYFPMSISHIHQDLNSLSNISLFRNLNESELQEILKESQIIKCKKGKILFSQEEKALNFYIVISGMIRLFINDADGMETTLQIVECDNFVNDMFVNNFQTNAQAMEDSKLLSMPLQKFRESVKNNLSLANNIIAATSSKNEKLVNQLIHLKLSNAKQKVGNFLLGMSFEKSGDKTQNIQLKCDKSTIASYLGINPETFSRTLRKLKDDGEISIEQSNVTLLQKQSLCKYCDSETSAKCNLRSSNFCEENK